MQCPWCQHDNPAGQKFCGECAAPFRPTPVAKSIGQRDQAREHLTIATTMYRARWV
jgi:hypothetical protein